MSFATDPEFFDLLAGSYRRLLGQAPPFLAEDPPFLAEAPPFVANSHPDAARWLYEDAPACVLAHNTEPDPRFIYANRAAQTFWSIAGKRSYCCPRASLPKRAERQRLLDAVSRDGFATGYSGIRIAKSGRRFRIEDGVLWQLRDAQDALLGVAATFTHWRNLD